VGKAIDVWTGSYGEYPIPAEFAGVRFRWDGLPDRRCNPKLRAEFMVWVAEQEAKAKAAMEQAS